MISCGKSSTKGETIDMKNIARKLKAVIAVCFILGLVAGCSRQPTPEEYEQSNKWCDDFGGVESKAFSEGAGLRIKCIDGHLIIKHFSN